MLVSLVSVISVASLAAEPFQDWVKSRAAEEGMLEPLLQADLDGDGRKDDIACVVFPGGAVAVVGLASGGRFAKGDLQDCPTARATAIDMGLPMPGSAMHWSYAFPQGHPTLLSESANSRYGSTSTDWTTGTWTQIDNDTADGREVRTEGSLVIATRTGVAAPAPRTWVTWQKKPHGGAQDAALQISARPDGNGGAVLTLSATDDVKIPLAGTSPKDVLKADHFELWIKQGGQRRQLGVAEGPSGPVAVWFFPEDQAPLPVVRKSAAGLQVELPASLFSSSSGYPSTDLTVVFSDADSAEGQEALLSTVSVRPGPESVDGRLVILPEGGRSLPTNWHPIDETTSLQALVGR